MIGSVTCDMSKTRIWLLGRRDSFRSALPLAVPSGRRGVSSSRSGVRWNFWGSIGVRDQSSIVDIDGPSQGPLGILGPLWARKLYSADLQNSVS
jgi:hypothetical protein